MYAWWTVPALAALSLFSNTLLTGAEVALIAVRRTRLKQMAADGRAGARAALNLLGDPERLLSAIQVGISLCSLGLGVAAIPPVAGWLADVVPVPRQVAWGLAVVVVVFLHAVLSEVAPKNIAIDKAERLAVLLGPPLLVFCRITGPFVYLAERASAGISALFGRRGPLLGGGHSAEEMRLIINARLRQANIESFEERAFQRLLDVQDLLVREIMVPRNEIISIPVDTSLDEILRFAGEHRFSRIPVYQDQPERIIGIVHYKDLLTVWQERRAATEKRRPVPRFDLRHLMTRPFVVPETKPLNQLIDDFRSEHSHMAIVVDEFGTVVGLVTMEDALEQIFGEIEDEHDAHLPPVVPLSPELELDGGTTIRELEINHSIELPVDAGYETLAGYLLHRLGYIPRPGDTLESDGCKFTVLETDKNRIARVRIER